MELSKNHPTKSLLGLLKEQNVIRVNQVSGDTDTVVVKLVKENRKTKKDFTIRRKGQDQYELTVVGRDGQPHVMKTDKKGKDGHFTDEGKYRRAIEQAGKQNSRA